MTAAELLDNVERRLEEDPTAPIFFTRAELLIILNEGYIEFVLMSGYLQSQVNYTMIGSMLQATPDNCMGLLGVQFQSQPVEKSSVQGFDEANRRWDYQNGYLSQWAPCGLDRWFCNRNPQTGFTVNLITLDQPAALDEADTIDMENEYVKGLEDYTFSCARFKEGGPEFQDAQPAYDDFSQKAGMREERTFTQQFVLWTRDPSADTGPSYSTLDRS